MLELPVHDFAGLADLPGVGDLELQAARAQAEITIQQMQRNAQRIRREYVLLIAMLRNTGKGAWGDMGPPSFRDSLFKTPKGTTRNRRWLETHTGKVQVPYLIDANTGTAMYESQAIIAYLNQTYAI